MTNESPSEFKLYKRGGATEMRLYVQGEDLTGISVSEPDKATIHTEGGWIARNPENHADQWFVAAAYFRKQKFEAVNQSPRLDEGLPALPEPVGHTHWRLSQDGTKIMSAGIDQEQSVRPQSPLFTDEQMLAFRREGIEASRAAVRAPFKQADVPDLLVKAVQAGLVPMPKIMDDDMQQALLRFVNSLALATPAAPEPVPVASSAVRAEADQTDLRLRGEMITIGDMSEDDVPPMVGVPAVQVRLAGGRVITLTGLTREECRTAVPHFLNECEVTVGATHQPQAAESPR